MNRLILLALFLLLIALALPISSSTASRQDALDAIQRAELDMAVMSEAGFWVLSVNDTITEARKALERADFAEALRQGASGELANRARDALEGLNYQGFTYDDVLSYTGEVSSRREQAFLFSDSLRALELKAAGYKKLGVDTAEAEGLRFQALDAFEKERYQETDSLLSSADSDLDEKRAELTTLNAVVRSGRGFLEKNWPWILGLVVVILAGSWFSWRRYKIKKLRKRLRKLRAEEKSLVSMIKKAQSDRYKKGTIPKFLFDIKMAKYRGRLNEVKEGIPVLEARLKGKKAPKTQKARKKPVVIKLKTLLRKK